MTDVVVDNIDVVVEVQQPTVPPNAIPPKIGLVEINQVVTRGSAWTTGNGPPTGSGGQYGDMYLDVDTGDIYFWDGNSWDLSGTFAPSTDTPEEVLAKLVTVDGAGSALDADLLDGQHGAYYARQSDMDANTSHDAGQDSQLSGLNTNVSNNTAAISALQSSDTAQNSNLTTINADQITQNNRLTAVENKNTAQDTTIAGLAPIANPVFTGDPRGPTPALSDNDTSLVTSAWVTSKLAALPPSGIPEAPNDGVQYVRQSLNWAPVIVPPGTYVADSPPASPSPNQLWWKSNLGQLFIYYLDPGGAPAQWVQAAGSATGQVRNTARSRNRINNPTAQVSQENGSTNVSTTTTYPADQWVLQFAGVVGNAQRLASIIASPEGTTTGIALYASTAKPSLAATDYLALAGPIEGLDVVDLGWGTAGAKSVVARFCAICATPGTYAFSIANGAGDRCWCGSFTITSANVPQVFSYAIPGDVTGTWLKDTGIGIRFRFGYAVGSNFVGVAGWNAGAFQAPPGCTNGAAVTNPLYITDVGLYSDPDNTGLPPPFVAPAYEDDLARCCRYWQKAYILWQGSVTSGSAYAGVSFLTANPRAAPSVAGTPNGASTGFPNVVGTLSGLPPYNAIQESRTANATNVSSYYNTVATVSARLI